MNKTVSLFPVWAIAFSLLAYFNPAIFAPYKSFIVPLLALVMFGMGMTLRLRDFARVLTRPKVIILALALQFLLMPLAAYFLSKMLGLSTAATVGMVLVGASSGGTASNVICYLAKADVALSILLTMASTLLAVLLMPALTFLYLQQIVAVDPVQMLKSIATIVLLPVLLGCIINSIFGKKLAKVQSILPLISCAAIVFIIAIIVALNHANLRDLALPVMLAVCLHNAIGLAFGYAIPKLLK